MPLFGSKFKTRIAIVDRSTEFLEFDATVKETHTGAAQPTDHPVESGTDITDHVRRLPEELQVTGIVSNSPIMFLASFRAEPSVPGTDPAARAEAAYNFLRDIKDQARLVDVSTKLRDYSSMALTMLSCTRDKDTSNIVQLDLTFREIQIAQTETVAPPADAAKAPIKKLGNKAKKAAPPPAAESALSKLFSLFGA